MTDLPGFADPVSGSQSCFAAMLQAIAHPGRIVQTDPFRAPEPLAAATGAVLLTLADGDTPLWLGPGCEGAWDWVRFHCGAPAAGPGEASFAVCLDLPALELFRWGTHEGPETGATIVLQRPSFETGPRVRLSGPGLREAAVVQCGLPDGFAERWRANHAAFPRGVDLFICAGRAVAAIPRSTRVEAA